MKLKWCYDCKQNLPLDDFGNNRSKPDGKATECRQCKSKKDKLYRERNKQKIKDNKRKYYLENRNEIISKVCAYAKDNRIEHNARGVKTKQRLMVPSIEEKQELKVTIFT